MRVSAARGPQPVWRLLLLLLAGAAVSAAASLGAGAAGAGAGAGAGAAASSSPAAASSVRHRQWRRGASGPQDAGEVRLWSYGAALAAAPLQLSYPMVGRDLTAPPNAPALLVATVVQQFNDTFVFRYDLNADAWSELPPSTGYNTWDDARNRSTAVFRTPQPRYGSAGGVCRGRTSGVTKFLYIAGRINAERFNDSWAFDVATRAWRPLGAITPYLSSHMAGNTGDDTGLWVYGGVTNNLTDFSAPSLDVADLWLIDAETEQATLMVPETSKPPGRCCGRLVSPKFSTWDLLMMGGFTDNFDLNVSNVLWGFRRAGPSGGTWSVIHSATTPDTPTARSWGFLTHLPAGFGGASPEGSLMMRYGDNPRPAYGRELLLLDLGAATPLWTAYNVTDDGRGPYDRPTRVVGFLLTSPAEALEPTIVIGDGGTGWYYMRPNASDPANFTFPTTGTTGVAPPPSPPPASSSSPPSAPNSSTAPTDADSDEGDGGEGDEFPWIFVAIGIGACLLLLCIVALILFLVKKKKDQTDSSTVSMFDLATGASAHASVAPAAPGQTPDNETPPIYDSLASVKAQTAEQDLRPVEDIATEEHYARFTADDADVMGGNYGKIPKPGAAPEPAAGIGTLDVSCMFVDANASVGEGEFGAVYRGVYQANGGQINCAVKMLKDDFTQAQLATFYAEAETMAKIPPHHFIVGFVGAAPAPFMIVTELCELGSVYGYLRRRDTNISLGQQIQLVRDIAEGMAWLAQNGIIHRDLAARNVLLTSEMVPKIADFGLSRAMDQVSGDHNTKSSTGPAFWWAVETIRRGNTSEKSDVWAFSVTAWEIFDRCGHRPYSGTKRPAMEIIGSIIKGERLEYPDTLPSGVLSLMEDCTREKPRDRPTFAECLARLDAVIDGDDDSGSEELVYAKLSDYIVVEEQ